MYAHLPLSSSGLIQLLHQPHTWDMASICCITSQRHYKSIVQYGAWKPHCNPDCHYTHAWGTAHGLADIGMSTQYGSDQVQQLLPLDFNAIDS